MKYLVTGSAGFIGFHVAQALLSDGHNVVGLDNFNDYYDPQLKRDRHAILENIPNYQGVEADICDLPTLEKCFNDNSFDAVCHLAAQAGVRYSITNPHVYEKTNLEGFLNILECCRHSNIKRLVYASSSSVYGGNTKLPFSETDNVDTPISLYAATKKANELMAHTYSHLYGIQTVGLRFFTVYGPWGRPDMAMWLFTEAMLKGETINVFNHGEMQRDFTFVDDIAAGVTACLTSDNLEQYEIFNLGNHRSEQLMDMINAIGDNLDIKPIMKMLPMQAGDVPATYADISRAQEKLQFEPKTPISEGIPQFIQWYRKYKGV
jgi:UDP-glucuronate 4-epimerase